MNYGRRFVTLYRRQGSRPSPWKRNAKKNNGDKKEGSPKLKNGEQNTVDH